jgi:uncharacterized LabA/DUF88 family protein
MNSRNPRKATPARMPVVPMHRGPQAGTASYSGQGFHAPNAALLIDFDNVTTGIRSDLGNELRNLLSSDIIKGKVAVQRAYADWRRYPQHMVPLAEASIDTIQATAYGSAKKNATDIRLAVDAIELVFTRPEIGTYILLSGDSDFSSLVLKLKEYGKYVIGVGIRESSSDLLVMNCDEYYSYNALAGLVKTGDEEAAKYDPWELVTEAVTRMKRNGDVMRSDRLKQVMQEIDPDFDEKELGHPKFSRFCLEAAQRGLLSVTKLENGQLEVDLPREKAAAAAPAQRARTEAAPAPAREGADADGEDRGRSRGRRGRGRGRDRGERPSRAEPESRVEVDPNMDTAEMPIPDAEVHEAITDGGRRPREERPAREARPPRDAGRSAAAPAARVDAGAASGGSDIGVSGERLTREEAFGLVRRAVEAMTSGAEDVVRASDVRVRARELLGRDSQTLAEHFFGRILRDAHDADVIDLRRRGDDFEVARAAEAAPVSEQLSRTAPPPSSATAASPAAPPRGMGPRGGGPTRGGRGSFGAKVGAPPPDLLSIGVVDITPSTASREPVTSREPVPVPLIEPTPPLVVDAETVEAEPPAAPAASKRGTRARASGGRAAKKPAAKTAAPPAEDKPRRTRAKKTARTSEG